MDTAHGLQNVLSLVGAHIFAFLGASPREVCNGWELYAHSVNSGAGRTIPDQKNVLRVLQNTLVSHTTLLYMYKTFWDIYSFTEFTRRIRILRITSGNYDELRVIATCPHCRHLLTHPSLIGIGASPAKLLMILANISHDAWNAVGDHVVFFRPAVATKLIDSLLMVTTALLQACCDKRLLYLHWFGAWILYKQPVEAVCRTCPLAKMLGQSYRNPPEHEVALRMVYDYYLSIRRPLTCKCITEYWILPPYWPYQEGGMPGSWKDTYMVWSSMTFRL